VEVSALEPIELREWEEGDLPLIHADMGDPEMTR
jgi:RimJ/RimL family protein N-acetyltransferase